MVGVDVGGTETVTKAGPNCQRTGNILLDVGDRTEIDIVTLGDRRDEEAT